MKNDSNTIDWLLRIGVALQCAGNAWLLGLLNHSPLMSWLWEPADVGGLALGEARALIVTRIVAAILFVTAASAIVWPSRGLLVLATAIQLLMTIAAWQIETGYPLDVSWLGDRPLRPLGEKLVALFPFATGAARIALPLALFVVHWSPHRKLIGVSLGPTTEWLIRVAIALTFFGHGVEALQRNPKFVDMIIAAGRVLLGVDVPQLVAEMALTFIGAVDIAVAVLVLLYRSRRVAGYLAFWGLVTAASRLVVLSTISAISPGWGAAEFCLRASHWVLPLVLFFAWKLARSPKEREVS